MTRITDFRCVDEDDSPVRCDPFGNNVALVCPNCGHPIRAIARVNQRGADSDNPAVCRKGDFKCWIEVDDEEKLVRVHAI